MRRFAWVALLAVIVATALVASPGSAAAEPGSQYCVDLKGQATGDGELGVRADGANAEVDVYGEGAEEVLQALKEEFDSGAGNESGNVVEDPPGSGRFEWCITKANGVPPRHGVFGYSPTLGFEKWSSRLVGLAPPPDKKIKSKVMKVGQPPAGDGTITEIISLELTGGGDLTITIGPLSTENKSAQQLNEEIQQALEDEGFRTSQRLVQFPVLGLREAIVAGDHPRGEIVGVELSDSDSGLTEGGLGLQLVTDVGGITELFVDSSEPSARAAEASGSSSPPYAAIAGAAVAGALALTTGAWYARRRWIS